MANPKADGLTATGLFRRMVLFYATSFLINGFYGPFFPIWLSGKGYSPSVTAFVLALPMFVRIFGTPLLTLLADRLGNHRTIALVLLAITFVCFSAPMLMPGVLGLAIFSFANCLAYPPVGPLAETFAFVGVNRFGLDYGRMRMWGSIMFVVANLLGGLVLQHLGLDSILVLILISVALTFGVCTQLPGELGAADRSRRARLGDVGVLVADARFAMLLLTAAFIQGSHGVLNAFAGVSWRDHGISQEMVGVLSAVGVVSEVVMMAMARRGLSRFGATGLLAIGAGASLVRWIALGFDPPLPVLLVLQLMHGLTFGATHIGAMNELARSVPQRLSATAQGLYAAATAGIAPGVTVLMSGPLYAHLGVEAYWIMAVIAAAALALAVRFQAMAARAGSMPTLANL